MNRPIVKARKIVKMRCISGLVMCSLVIILTCVALTLNIANYYKDVTPESRLGTFRMYTTLSNILAAVAASLCIPFQIDGLKRDNYKLPDWIVGVLYVGTVGVFVTFFSALTAISIYQGFVKTMFTKSNLFFHTINPIIITLSFTLIISDSKIKFHNSFFTMIPVVIYAIVYFVMVYATGIWRDHYQANTFIPWPIALLIVISLAFGLSQLLRWLHNLTNKYVNKHIERYYMESDDYKFDTLEDAIKHLADEGSKFYQKGQYIYVPMYIIDMLSKRYSSDMPSGEQYSIYLKQYASNINK